MVLKIEHKVSYLCGNGYGLPKMKEKRLKVLFGDG
jgi:hypothetical protein